MPYKLKHKRLTALTVFASLLVFSIFGFVALNMRDLLFGSPLLVTTAKDGDTLTDGFLPVSGKARHARSVTINGRSLLIDRDGNFSDAVLLSPGYNVVQVALLNQFGKEKVRTYHLVLDASDTVAQVSADFYKQ